MKYWYFVWQTRFPGPRQGIGTIALDDEHFPIVEAVLQTREFVEK